MPSRKKINHRARLEPHFRPERYKIMLHPDLEKFTFNGEETIYFSLTKPDNKIILHAHELKIKLALLKNKAGEIRAKKINFDARSETATIFFHKKIPKGGGELELKFEGVLNDKMRGFYRSQFEHEGRTKYIVTTQFESTDARRAFPCVDEPSAKAVFDVTLIVPKHFCAISNTYETSVKEHKSGYQIVEFAPTPKMSTYLLAFIAGEFEHIEAKTKEGITVRVFTTPGKINQAKFALDVAFKTLSYFTGYFKVPYPLPVLDLIAIPDFAAGAMENWGAVTYRESVILVDPDHSSLQNKQWVALVIAHELAHQWFGNLVTMEWWTHLWLNEGFASWIEYLAVDHIFPKWDIWTQFVRMDLSRAFQLDALLNTHPIEVAVNHPNEIGEIFDAVSYSKGASIIRMLADYIGEKDFRNGLRHYLKKHQYANAATDDLWKAFEEVSGKPVKNMMKHWTGKPGYPVLRVSDKDKSFEIHQHRFFSSALSRKNNKDKTMWPLPLTFIFEGAKKPVTRFFKTSRSALDKKKASWTKFNAGAVGMFRIDYPVSLLEKFKVPIEKKELSASDRFSIQNDAFALAESGELATSAALNLALSYRLEDNFSIWADLAENIGKVNELLEGTRLEEPFKKFAQEIFAVLMARLGWEKKKNESHPVSLLRGIAISQSGRYGDDKVISKARELFSEHIKGRHIHPDIRGAIYYVVALNSGKKEYVDFLKLFRKASLHEEKNRLSRALGFFWDEKSIEKTLRFLLSDEVRLQDKPSIFGVLWSSPLGREMSWKFFRRNWFFFLKNYGEGSDILHRVISPIGTFTSVKRAQEIKAFFNTHKFSSAERTIEQAIERVNSNADWLRRDFKHLEKWLLEQK